MPDEIIRRIKRLQEGGIEYVMVIDFAARAITFAVSPAK